MVTLMMAILQTVLDMAKHKYYSHKGWVTPENMMAELQSHNLPYFQNCVKTIFCIEVPLV